MSESTSNFVKKNFAKRIEVRVKDANCHQSDKIGVKQIGGYIDAAQCIPVFTYADNSVNPRSAEKNPVVCEIVEGLYTEPEEYAFKTNGIVIGTTSCLKGRDSKYSIELVQNSAVAIGSKEADMPEVDPRFAGVVDGGHSLLALMSYIYGVLYNKDGFIFKNWAEAKVFYKSNYGDIIERYGMLEGKRKEMLNLEIPIRIVAPIEESTVLCYKKRLPRICAGHNKSAQLSVPTLANNAGKYEYFKEVFPEFPVLWKDGDTSIKKSESIPAADIVKLGVIPLSFLEKNGKLDKSIGAVDKKKHYTSKASCLKIFDKIAEGGRYFTMQEGNAFPTLSSPLIKSAIDMTKDIAMYADRLYAEFPKLFNKVGSRRFGMLKEVDNKPNKAYPYKTLDKELTHKYPTSYLAALIAGVTELMWYNPETDRLEWQVNPASEAFNVNDLDITTLVNRFAELSFQPNDCGKTPSCYEIADAIYRDYLLYHPQTGVKVA